MNIRPFALLLVVVAVGALGGCATGEKSDAEIARAKVRVDQAQQGGAAQHAPAELQASVDNLRRAEAAAVKGDDDVARELARRAEADAEVAEAKARRVQADIAAREVQSGTEALREEADRALVSPPPEVAEPAKGEL